MGKKIYLIEVDDTPTYSSSDSGAATTFWTLCWWFALTPFTISILSIVAFRARENKIIDPFGAFLMSCINAGLLLIVDIVFFVNGGMELAAFVVLCLILWNCINIVFNILTDKGIGVIFIENTKLDIAIFLTVTFLFSVAVMEIYCDVQKVPDVVLRNITNLMWIVFAIVMLHMAGMITFRYLNNADFDDTKKKKISKFYGVGISIAGYACLALPYFLFALLFAIDTEGVWRFWSANHMFYGEKGMYVLVCVSAALMITEGILTMIGRNGICASGGVGAKGGIKKGIVALVFAAVSVMVVALSLNLTPAIEEWHVGTKADLLAFHEYADSASHVVGTPFNENMVVYLDADIDLEGARIESQYGNNNYPYGGTFNGQGHKIINGEFYGGLFLNNHGIINDFALENCNFYDNGLVGTNEKNGEINDVALNSCSFWRAGLIGNENNFGKIRDIVLNDCYFWSSELVATNNGEMENITLDHCYFLCANGTFAEDNNGTITNCHALETYIYVQGEGYCGCIALHNSGRIENCSFVNTNQDERFAFSVCRGSIWDWWQDPYYGLYKIANNKSDNKTGKTVDCEYVGTMGKSTPDFIKSYVRSLSGW